MDDHLKIVKDTIAKVMRPFVNEKKFTKRRERLSASRRERLYVRHYAPMNIWRATCAVMEEAYMKASANNTLPANARQIMYQARPLIQKLTTKMWKSDRLFTQDYLPRFLRENPNLTSSWDVVYDARGHFEEPHTNHRVDLGTLGVRRYVNNWTDEIPEAKIDPIELEIKTNGPANRYKFALFIEKQGFDSLLARADISKLFDIALMSTKGYSVTASRQLVEDLSSKGVTILVAHDFDVDGFGIYRTLREDTTRYQFACKPNVESLGLRLSDINEMNLDSESVDLHGDPSYELEKAGATPHEIAMLVGDRRRVELNAMTSGQFIDWLKRKLNEHGVTKIVPAKGVLESAYQLATLNQKMNEAIARIQGEWGANGHVDIPADLEEQVREIIAEKPELSWDQAVALVASPVEEEGDV